MSRRADEQTRSDASHGLKTAGFEAVVDALACVEDVRLAEMWSQGVFIDRRHDLAVVVLVLQLRSSVML